ncbi:MAG: toxin, partial [Patescibacteria group bacterium]|nr:toxin [Patescibacteria group bacterium]
MKYGIEFSEEKNLILQETRGVCFKEVVKAFKNKNVLDDISNKNYSKQKIFVVKIKNYVYAVPYVIDKKKKTIFLKTVYPSRALTK